MSNVETLDKELQNAFEELSTITPVTEYDKMAIIWKNMMDTPRLIGDIEVWESAKAAIIRITIAGDEKALPKIKDGLEKLKELGAIKVAFDMPAMPKGRYWLHIYPWTESNFQCRIVAELK